MSKPLWSMMHYENPIPYYSGYLVEYDLRKANINSLRSRGVIDEKTYQLLATVDKSYREIYIGKMIKSNQKIYDEIQAGIIDAKHQFFNANDLKDNEVLYIKNDAVCVMSQRSMKTTFGRMEFVNKGAFTSFFQTNKSKLQILYRFDTVQGSDVFEVKGISEATVLKYHAEYMLNFILTVLYDLERSSIEETLRYCNQFYESYVSRQLPLEYYRELNPESKYRVIVMNQQYLLTGLNEEDKALINIDYNLKIIRDLISCVNSVYFQRRGKWNTRSTVR